MYVIISTNLAKMRQLRLDGIFSIVTGLSATFFLLFKFKFVCKAFRQHGEGVNVSVCRIDGLHFTMLSFDSLWASKGTLQDNGLNTVK